MIEDFLSFSQLWFLQHWRSDSKPFEVFSFAVWCCLPLASPWELRSLEGWLRSCRGNSSFLNVFDVLFFLFLVMRDTVISFDWEILHGFSSFCQGLLAEYGFVTLCKRFFDLWDLLKLWFYPRNDKMILPNWYFGVVTCGPLHALQETLRRFKPWRHSDGQKQNPWDRNIQQNMKKFQIHSEAFDFLNACNFVIFCMSCWFLLV